MEAPAMARDIGLFGNRKRNTEREAVQELKKEEEEGEKKKQVTAAGSAPDSSSSSSSDSGSDSSDLATVWRPSPVAQAAAVVGAEIAATLIASSIVTGILNKEA
jgi:hypothetical protein